MQEYVKVTSSQYSICSSISVCEYCSAVYHSSLTIEQSDKIEAIQSTALKIILSSTYTNYKSALSKFSLQTLSERRQRHMQRFALKCISDTFNTNMFPLNTNRHSEKFYVNFARTSQYLHSSIPQCQRLLNTLSNQERNKVDHLLQL